MAKSNINPVVIEDTRIMFRNFTGAKGQYNAEGDRNFCVPLDADIAAEMKAVGWNIKQLAPREDGDAPQDYIKVKVSYKENQRPPKVVLVTSRGKNELTEDTVSVLDWADISKVDLIISPYEWTVRESSGVTAYLKSIFVHIVEDELDLKYADLPEAGNSAQSAMVADGVYFRDEDE